MSIEAILTKSTNPQSPNIMGSRSNSSPPPSSSIDIDPSQLDDSRWWRAIVAGSIAGLTEHFTLYPIDTVKTRMQAVLHHRVSYRGFLHAFKNIVQHEGASALFRGLPAVLTAAIPSHGAYFGSYEYAKHALGTNYQTGHHPLLTAMAGCCATCAHDLMVTPFDVIKQRMQLRHSPYPNIYNCAMHIFRNEGILTFYRSYPATVLLNVPVFTTNFMTYESSKKYLRGTSLESEETWYHHLFAGGLAGAAAGLVSNPLDVIKTSIQTDTSPGYKSITVVVKRLLQLDQNFRYRILFSGASARIVYFIPSASITWTTYEAVKRILNFPIDDLEMH